MRTISTSCGLLGTSAALLAVFLVAGLGRPVGMTLGLATAFAVAAGTSAWSARAAERRLLWRLLAGLRQGDEEGGDLPPDDSDARALWAALGRTLQRLRRAEVEARPVEVWARRLVASGAVPPDSASDGSAVARALAELARVADRSGRGFRGMAASADRLGQDASDQERAATACAAINEAVSSAVDRVVEDSEAAARAGQGARREARRGADLAREAVQSLDRIRAHVEVNGRKIRRHSDRSLEIGAIIELIAGISQRTDTVVLNATIESVRAGEHGRGFAVVAEEIRKLAERTADAAKEIAALVQVIQSETIESTLALEGEQVDILHGVRRIREVASALDRIGELSDQSAHLSGSVSLAVGQQGESLRESARAARRGAETTGRIADETAQLGAACRVLAEHQSRLRRLAGAEPAPAGSLLDESESSEPMSPQVLRSSRGE